MKASPRILSSPGAPWRSTGRPVTAMRARHWPIPRFLSFLIDTKGCARSISAKSGPGVRRHGECDASLEKPGGDVKEAKNGCGTSHTLDCAGCDLRFGTGFGMQGETGGGRFALATPRSTLPFVGSHVSCGAGRHGGALGGSLDGVAARGR